MPTQLALHRIAVVSIPFLDRLATYSLIRLAIRVLVQVPMPESLGEQLVSASSADSRTLPR